MQTYIYLYCTCIWCGYPWPGHNLLWHLLLNMCIFQIGCSLKGLSFLQLSDLKGLVRGIRVQQWQWWGMDTNKGRGCLAITAQSHDNDAPTLHLSLRHLNCLGYFGAGCYHMLSHHPTPPSSLHTPSQVPIDVQWASNRGISSGEWPVTL